MSSIKSSMKINSEEFENKTSYWLNYEKKGGDKLIDISQLKNAELIADALLNEFDHSDEEQKKFFKKILVKWLSNEDLELSDKENFYQIRDLIYEMF